jgi:hypothetical protein
LLGLQAFISYNVNTPGGFSLVVANSYDFFPLGTDAPICVLEIFIGRRILPTSILPVVCRVNCSTSTADNRRIRAQRFEGLNFCARQTL